MTLASQGWIVHGHFRHCGRSWTIVQYQGSFYARDDQENDTGPYSTVEEARDWIKDIQP